MSKMYIAVVDDFPDFMTPTLVAHAVLQHNEEQTIAPYESGSEYQNLYEEWITDSFRKVVVRVNKAEWEKIKCLPNVTLTHENKTNNAEKSCAVVVVGEEIPPVLKFAKLWKPKENDV